MVNKKSTPVRTRTTLQLIAARGEVDELTVSNFASLEEYRAVVPRPIDSDSHMDTTPNETTTTDTTTQGDNEDG